MVTIFNDTRVEGNENINLSLQSQSPGTGIGTVRPTATISILDDDTGFSFSSPNYVVLEGRNTLIPVASIFGFTNFFFGTNVTITVIRQGGSNGVVSVEFETIDPAVLGATGFDPNTFTGDYVRVTNMLTFADGQTSSNLTISVLDDFLVEGDELVTLRLLNPQPSLTTSLGTQPNATLTIVDDDVSFGFSQTNYVVSEKVSPAVVTIVRRGLSTGDVSVVFTTRNGTAGAGSDYTTVSNVLTWTANDLSSRNVNIPIANDGNPEGLETVFLDLSNPTGGAFLDATNGAATLSIVDNAGSIAFTSSTYNGNESNGVANITLARTGGSNGIVTVAVVVSNGTAIGGLDFTNTTGIVVAFANGEISKTFPIALINDSLAEGLETLTMSLRNPTGGALLGAPTNATLRIEDDEVNIIAAGSSLIAESLMPTNNIIDPNETVTVRFAHHQPDGHVAGGQRRHAAGTDHQCLRRVDDQRRVRVARLPLHRHRRDRFNDHGNTPTARRH
jgi:hypothetical protein